MTLQFLLLASVAMKCFVQDSAIDVALQDLAIDVALSHLI